MLENLSYTEAHTPQDIMEVFEEVRDILKGINWVTPEGTWVSCHEIAKTIEGFVPDLVAVRGYFLKRGQEHSWLEFRNNSAWIIDAYPIAAVGGPLLLDVSTYTSPWFNAYVSCDPHDFSHGNPNYCKKCGAGFGVLGNMVARPLRGEESDEG